MTTLPDFAAYPRARLILQWHRRAVLTSLMTEIRVRSDRNGGGIKLPDLGVYPDDLLELLTPVVHQDFEAEGDAAFVTAVALMNGARTIKQVAERLEVEIGWDRERAFQYARGVFLHLVAGGWCLPNR